MSPIPEPQKDTIYLDVDDEITGIIDRVRSSSSKIVALVLPKRATVLHSVVNMKLLKRAADQSKKHIVLITSEAGVLPLAGVVGVHVAKTLQSKPAVPAIPSAEDGPLEVAEADTDTETDVDPSKPVGVLAGLTPDNEEETIEVDNSDKTPVADTTKQPKNKKLKIPNFEKFRTRVFLGIGLFVLLIVGWVFAAMVLPKATITIKTKTSDIASKLTMTASPAAKELAKEGNIVPATSREFKKSDAAKVAATGEKNNGTKATGTMVLINCTDNNVTVPAGTTFTNSNLSFVSDQAVTVPASDFFSAANGGACKKNRSANVTVTAAGAGDQYNLSQDRDYTSNFAATLTGRGSAMSGGTSKIVKVVSQTDIDNAKQKILDQNLQAAKDELAQQLRSTGFLPLTETFAPGNPVVTATPNVGEESNEVSVNVTITYTMVGPKEDAVKQLVEDDIKQHIDVSKQEILDNGINKAEIQILEKLPNGNVKFTLSFAATAGVQQDAATIKRAVAGKKRHETQTIIQERPGIEDVTIRYSPFWVVSTPKKQSKIVVIFE